MYERQDERERDEQAIGDGCNPVSQLNGDDHPVRGEVRDSAAFAPAAVDPPVVDRARDRMDDDPEDERTADDDG
jgi:hypothetical protein